MTALLVEAEEETAMDVIKAGSLAIALAQSSVGVPTECLVELHRRRGRSARQQRLRRPARLWWAR
jgi:hypothetical protein